MHSFDPFRLREAAVRATRTSPFANLERVFGFCILTIIRACAFLPWLLLMSLAPYAWISSPNLPATAAALLLWLYFLCFLAYNLRMLDNRTEQASTISGSEPLSAEENVLVIGAGPSGLAVVKECLAAGLSVKAYERKSSLGGVYYFTEDFRGGAWKECRLTSSPWVTAFSDFPPHEHSDRHLTHHQYVTYLRQYADHFDLNPHLFYDRTVIYVSRLPCGRWAVRVKDAKRGIETVELFKYVVVCIGSNVKPKDISVPGIENFKGEVLHAADYKQADNFKHKKVVIVGNGESAVDIAAQLAGTAQETFLCFRRGKFVIPRVDKDSGLANDYDTNRIRYAPPVVFRNWYMMFVRRLGYLLGRHDAVGAVEVQMLESSSVGPLSQTVTKSSDFINSFLKGALQVREDLVSFEGSTVNFRDGTFEKVDAVIFAHGYEISFPFLELPDEMQFAHPGSLYMRMFIPTVGERLAFCGFVRPSIGSIPPTAELQARYFALVASGRRMIPSEDKMRDSVKRQLKEGLQLFPLYKQPNLVVMWIRYMDELADAIGCRPNVWKLLHDPVLLWKVITGPVTGALYRLHGPGSDPIARATILSLTRTHPLIEIMVHFGFHFWLWPIAMVHAQMAWKNGNRFI